MTLFIANWKMYKTYNETIDFAEKHRYELEELSANKTKVIIAASFICLDALGKIFNKGPIGICAQNCASEQTGAFTGEVDASSLAQIGCTYTIIGHSDRRRLFHETNEMVAAKVKILFKNQIRPIICIGETQEEFDEGRTIEVLTAQLESLIKILDAEESSYCIAYEPIWAIGTGKTPNNEELENTFEWIFNYLRHEHCTLLYGGSVTEENAKKFLQIPRVGGLLIGKASCDFQSLKKIVSLL